MATSYKKGLICLDSAYEEGIYPYTNIDCVFDDDGNPLIDVIYPVGSIYMSVNSVNPSTLFSGTQWEQIKDTFLLACGDTYANGDVGGEAEHTLTTSEMPSHNHSINEQVIKTQSNGIFNGDYMNLGQNGSLGGWGIAQASANNRGGSRLRLPSHNTNDEGDGNAHNNMPPYLAIYMWKRIL